MKAYPFICIILVAVIGDITAQGQNNIWYFGNKAGMDFNVFPPQPLISDLFTQEGTASICDPSGNLLFYTNGRTVWDRTHAVMPNGMNLSGGESSTQAALIVPLPNSCDQYYVFTTEDHLSDGGLAYSIVDMCLNEGYGDIVSTSKNIPVQDLTAEKITAVLHANNKDIWIITHGLLSDRFHAYLLTEMGLVMSPVISSIGSFYPFTGHIGPAKASHDGTKIASAATFHNICEIFDFDNSTGIISNYYDINELFNGPRFVYGIEFSSNDSLLYLSTTFVTNYLYQIDLKSKTLHTLNTIPDNYRLGALQMGPDKKIYIARSDSSFLDVIHQPDQQGNACQYEEKGFQLYSGTNSTLGLPNFAPYSFFTNSHRKLYLGNDTTVCEGSNFNLHPDILQSCEIEFEWNDGSTEPDKVINSPGLYWVEAKSECSSFRDSIQINFASCSSGCESNGIAYGSEDENERGYCISATPENDGVYVAGIKGDSTLLLKIDLDGAVVWSRTFDLFVANDEYPYSLIIDSEGMIVLSGTTDEISFGGVIYVLRYDPYNHQTLWENEYVSSPNSTHGALLQKGNGGNYVMTNDLNIYSQNHIDVELMEIDKNTGVVIPAISKKFRLSNRESLFEIIYDGNFIYGTGRYSDGAGIENFRNTVVKLDPNDGSQVWVKLGHIPSGDDARLYGAHLLVDQDVIISGSYGDPSGISITDTKLYLQKTSLDGDLIWIKQYNISETNAYGYGIIKSANGYIVLSGRTLPDNDLVMFEIDHDGNVIWAKQFEYSSIIVEGIINPTIGGRGHTKLVESGGKLFYVAYGVGGSGNTDLLVVRTNLNGEVDMPCVKSLDFALGVEVIENPAFFSVIPAESIVNPVVTTKSPQGIENLINPREECNIPDQIISVEATICEGDLYEGYSISGTYTDTFSNIIGCDSLRVLELLVLDGYEVEIIREICEGEIFEGYSNAGMYSDTFTAANGCDSIRLLHLSVIVCQSECELFTSSIFGTLTGNEQGYSLAPTAENDGFYVAGLKDDSIRIIRMNLSDKVIWSRTFFMGSGNPGYVSTIILDSDGMLALSGNTGSFPFGNSIFVFRYDPEANLVLWSRKYRFTSTINHFGFTQKGAGGNYLITSTTNHPGNDDANIMEIDRNNGNHIVTYEYDLGSADGLADLVYHNGYIYGTGRYTDGPQPEDMRHVLAKLNGSDGSQDWVKLGHVPAHQVARLYGVDLVIDQDEIISCYHGDPSGTTTTTNSLFLQKTSLDGQVVWVKKYNLPGVNDTGVELIKSGQGFVVMAAKKASPSEIILFKIDRDGNILWSRLFQFPGIISNIENLDARTSQLIQVDDHLIFTAFGRNLSGGTRMVVIRADLQGQAQSTCLQGSDITIGVENILNPVFYSVTPDMVTASPQITNSNLTVTGSPVTFSEECMEIDTILGFVSATICQGESFEGYSVAGTYTDSFTNELGCDSLRTLQLDVLDDVGIEINKEICEGQVFEGYSTEGMFADTFAAINGCDSVRILHLTFAEELITDQYMQICLGDNYHGHFTSGIYDDTLMTVEGCDSIIRVTLEVIPVATFITISLCEGKSFESYSQAGFYLDTIQGINTSCDTIRNLTISKIPAPEFIINKSICEGDNYLGYFNPGTYVDTLITVAGCDSIRTINLSIAQELITDQYIEICLGDSYAGHFTSGIYQDTLMATAGCDSIIRTTLDVIPVASFVSVDICTGTAFESYSQAGFYIDTLPGINTPCDTIRHLTISVLPLPEFLVDKSICEGEDYFGYSEPGLYIDTLAANAGCDSIRHLQLMVQEPVHGFTSATLCEGSVLGYTNIGIFHDTIISSTGCDSIVTIEIDGGTKFIPNVFSPNGDGINDVFKVFQSSGHDLDLKYFGVFDRFGDLAYETSTWPIEWDGNNLRDQQFQSAVLTYVLIYNCEGRSIVENGTVTIVR